MGGGFFMGFLNGSFAHYFRITYLIDNAIFNVECFFRNWLKIKKAQLYDNQTIVLLKCTRGGNRTRTPLRELDFESSASTNSATRAR